MESKRRFKNSLSFCLCLLTLLFISRSVSSQGSWTDDLEIGFNYGSGYVLPEYEFINLLTESPSQNYEFSILKSTHGKTAWERLYKYPGYGLRILYSDLGNPDALGQVWGVYPYFRIRVIDMGKLQLFNESGLGYSRVNRKFDLDENFMNVAVGSYSNIHFNSRFLLSCELSERISISTALSFDHFSNGNTAEPNLGINYLSWMGGLSYRIGDKSERIEGELMPKDRETERELVWSIGGKHSRALTSQYYFTSSLSFEWRKKFFRALHLGVGGDLFYDTSVEDQLEKNGKAYQSIDQFQCGIHISQTFVYDRFSLTIQEGIYLFLKEQVENYTMYNRAIIKYRINDQLTARVSMKSHVFILDYPEFGVGWIF